MALYTDIFLDATALALLHTDKYRKYIPLILAKFHTYISKLSIIEFLAILNYTKAGYNKTLLDYIYRLYKLVELDPAIMERAARIFSDLLLHGIVVDLVDVIQASISIEKRLVMITADPSRYEPLKKYGATPIHVRELIAIMDQLSLKEREQGKRTKNV